MKRDAQALVQTQVEDNTTKFLHLGLTLIAFAASVTFTGQPAFFLMLVLSVAWAVLFFARNYHQQTDNDLRAYWLDRTLLNAWLAGSVICVVSFFAPNNINFMHGGDWVNTLSTSQHSAPSVVSVLMLAVYVVVLYGAECIKSKGPIGS